MEANEKNRIEPSTLYLVGTPIGNLADISERAVKVLSEVTFIAAEDTRNTRKLLTALGLRGELVSYHEHNRKVSGERILARLLAGESCALVTDAGMPAVSDPGEDLVRLCTGAGVAVTAVPGPCAAIDALVLSGMDTRRFSFEGFLPAKTAERRTRLTSLRGEGRTLLFYEAPHRLKETLQDLLSVFGGERRIALCRELTKRNEEVLRLTLEAAIRYYETAEPRGEYVLVLQGADEAGENAEGSESPASLLSPAEHVYRYEQTGMAHKDAIKAAAQDRGMSKSDFYKLLLQEKENG